MHALGHALGAWPCWQRGWVRQPLPPGARHLTDRLRTQTCEARDAHVCPHVAGVVEEVAVKAANELVAHVCIGCKESGKATARPLNAGDARAGLKRRVRLLAQRHRCIACQRRHRACQRTNCRQLRHLGKE
eukprot:364109-Chlamydomonas_euryale.AAC.5